MNKGYVISAITPIEHKQATALAYSIKSSNKSASVSIVSNNIENVNKEYYEPFDNIIQFPFTVKGTRRQNDWQLYWASPYEYTIAIDCKSLLKENQSQLWDYLIDGYDIAFPTQVLHYNGDLVNNKNKDIYSEEYNLKDLHTGFFYWRNNSDIALRYFKMCDVIMQYWEEAIREYLQEHHVPLDYDSNLMHSLIESLIGEDVNVLNPDIFNYIDMKCILENNYLGKWDKWTDRLSVWASAQGKIKIQNFAVNKLLNYNDDTFLTSEIFDEQRNYYRYTIKN